MNRYKNPAWWDPDDDFAWNHVKKAMKRDWDQTKHGQGGTAPEARQNKNDNNAVRGAGGMRAFTFPPAGHPTFEELEPAFRFGYGARLKFGGAYPEWDDDLEIRLAKDWRTMDPTRREKWEDDRNAILYGWFFEAQDSPAAAVRQTNQDD